MTAAGTLTTYTEHCSMPGAELPPIRSPDAVRWDHLTGQQVSSQGHNGC